MTREAEAQDRTAGDIREPEGEKSPPPTNQRGDPGYIHYDGMLACKMKREQCHMAYWLFANIAR
jgi:hypothetical protein